MSPAKSRLVVTAGMLSLACLSAKAQTALPPTPARPLPEAERWQEDWSALADPALRTGPFDALKYIPLSQEDGRVYVSLGGNARERIEAFDAPLFGTARQKSNTYLLDRLQLHADLHVDGWQAFVQFEDDRAPGKIGPGPADSDRLDLEQAFVAHEGPVGDGMLKLRVGREEFGFDLQRFVSTREGPNVRQAYDALWADYELGDWRVISFLSHPVQYRDGAAFDDYSGHNLALHGLRAERRGLGPGDLAIYYLRYQNDTPHFAEASGRERLNALDIHYSGKTSGMDFDAEMMGQQGSIGDRPVLAWAFGGRVGYTFGDRPWTPHPYLQIDAASGSTSQHGRFSTFNPLFPNGSYFPLAGLTSYANLIHVKPVLSVAPSDTVTLQAAIGLQWRQTTRDAVYAIPTQAIPNTAGRGDAWSAAYLQLDASKRLNPNATLSTELVRYEIGPAIRRAGGHDTTYAMVQIAVAW